MKWVVGHQSAHLKVTDYTVACGMIDPHGCRARKKQKKCTKCDSMSYLYVKGWHSITTGFKLHYYTGKEVMCGILKFRFSAKKRMKKCKNCLKNMQTKPIYSKKAEKCYE